MSKKNVELTRKRVFWATVISVGLILIGGLMNTYWLYEELSSSFRVWVTPLANAVIWSSLIIAGNMFINLTIDHYVSVENRKEA